MEPYERRTDVVSVVALKDTIWNRRGLWASILLGAVVGFAATVMLGTFGAAAGITAGAGAADRSYDSDRRETSGVDPGPSTEERREPETRPAVDRRRDDMQSSAHPSLGSPTPDRPARERERDVEPAPAPFRTDRPPQEDRSPVVTTEDDREAMKSAAIGGALWLIVSALVAGLIGGWTAGRFAPADRTERGIVGAGTWAVGILIMVSLAAFGASGLLGGLGAGAGEYMNGARADVDEETARAAAASAGIATWGFLIASLVGLGASILGADKAIKRRIRIVTVTDRPMGTTPASPALS